jgi:hypothetical protein
VAAAAQAIGKPGGVNNTAYLFFVLAMAFIVYITTKGDLPKWLGLLGLASQGATPQGEATGGTTGTPAVASGLPGLPAIPSIGSQTTGASSGSLPNTNVPIYDPYGNQTGYGNPNYAPFLGQDVDTSTFGGGGVLVDSYAGPTYIDNTSTF